MRFVWATILDPFRTFRYGIGLQILFESLSNPRCRTTAADRLLEHFSEAGLPYPHLFCEKLVGGSADSPLYGWLAELLQSLQPQLDRMRIVPGGTFTMEGLESRLRDAVVEAPSQIFGPAQVCAWARL
jgi:hypothetical protein